MRKGYLNCLHCHYPLRTKLSECLFNSKGDFCFDCSREIKEAVLSNFSLVEAMEMYKN